MESVYSRRGEYHQRRLFVGCGFAIFVIHLVGCIGLPSELFARSATTLSSCKITRASTWHRMESIGSRRREYHMPRLSFGRFLARVDICVMASPQTRRARSSHCCRKGSRVPLGTCGSCCGMIYCWIVDCDHAHEPRFALCSGHPSRLFSPSKYRPSTTREKKLSQELLHGFDRCVLCILA